MATRSLYCPNCGRKVSVETVGYTSVFCNYCGESIELDDAHSEFTYNKHVTVEKISHHRYTDDADIIRAKTQAKAEKSSTIGIAICFGFLILMMLAILIIPPIIQSTNEASGKISAGSSQDLIGKDYQSVEAHFRAAGFTDIELIDLNDSGLAFWDNGKVATISVGGKTTFSSYDYFDPDTKVIISYH